GAWLGGALGIWVFFALRRPALSRAAVGAVAAVALLAWLVRFSQQASHADHDGRESEACRPYGA
ncbi:MAG TPA: hypothetical protein VGH25_12160, partial [Dongiaceae bacterium]